MESAYSLANAEIAKIRKDNKDEQRRRETEVRLAAPEFATVEAKLAAGGLALSKCVLSGKVDISDIRAHIESAQKEKAAILARLSLPSDYLDDIYSCKDCRDTGFDEKGSRCHCLKNMISKYIGTNSNLTDIMREQTFDNFDFSLFENQPDIKGRSVAKIVKTIFDKALNFSDTFKKTEANLFMYGSAGTGKSYISSCIANKVLSRGFSVYYQSAFQLLDVLEKLKFGRYDDDEVSQADYATKYAYDVDLLIIDDVGTEFVSSYSSAALFDIINSRLATGKSTIISSNLSPSKIDETYGTRLASRIAGSYDVLAFVGADLRRIKK